MNFLIVHDGDYMAPGRIRIMGRRLEHLRGILKSRCGDTVKCAAADGMIGTGTVEEIDERKALITLSLHDAAPPKLPLSLVAALPRPKSFRKVLHVAATMGVEQIFFINAFKVEKSYWQSPFLSDDKIAETLTTAMEQSGDPVAPQLHFRKLFKPFVEDELPQLAAHFNMRIIGHPSAYEPCPALLGPQSTLLFIGPEGGFTDYEIAMLEKHGNAEKYTMGKRIMRTEVALAALIGRLY